MNPAPCAVSRRHLLAAVCSLAACPPWAMAQVAQQPIRRDMQMLVDRYTGLLVRWADHPVVVRAAQKSSDDGGIPGMTPERWAALALEAPDVQRTLRSEAGRYVDKLDNQQVNKVVVRDKHGNVVAANTKVVLYNVRHRPVFQTAIRGVPWQQPYVQKDVTTGIDSVQIAAPIRNAAGEIVGVIHASVTDAP
jgi:hypothetical protein